MRKVAEIVEVWSPEDCAKVAEEALRLMESGDEFDRLEAQGMLDGSKCIARVWEFYCPPRVYLTRIFDDPMTAERDAKNFRALGINARRTSKRLDDKIMPAVKIDWQDHYLLGEFFNEAFGTRWSSLDERMNRIVRRYSAERSRRRALRMLAREAAKMTAELMSEWEGDEE